MDVCPGCDAAVVTVTQRFCPTCGALRPESGASSSSGELLRTLLTVAAERKTPPRGSTTPASTAPVSADRGTNGTLLYGANESIPSLPAPGATSWSSPPVPDAPATEGVRSFPTFAEVEATLYQRIQTVADGANRLVDLLCLVAQADGKIDNEEHASLARTLSAVLGNRLHEAVVKHLIRSSLREIASDGIDKRIQMVTAALRATDTVEEGLIIALALAYVSDGFSNPERAIIQALANELSVPSDRLSGLIRRVRDEVGA